MGLQAVSRLRFRLDRLAAIEPGEALVLSVNAGPRFIYIEKMDGESATLVIEEHDEPEPLRSEVIHRFAPELP